MRILLLIPALAPVYGGTSQATPSLAVALGRRGWQVDLIATNANGKTELAEPVGTWIQRNGYRERYFTRLGTSEYKLSPSLFAWLLRRVRDYDLVHINSSFNFPVFAAAAACRLRAVPYIVVPHGMLEPWALDYKAGKKRLYYFGVEKPVVLHGARAIQALNAREAANIRALALGPPVIVTPNGIHPGEATADSRQAASTFLDRYPAAVNKALILFLHRVDRKKGLDILAPAFAVARARFPQTHLIVAGPATDGFEATARGYFQDAGVAEAVTFTGMLDGALKSGAFATADVFVAPSYSEGFSMSVLEAMAAGLPCVLTEGCNFPEAAAAQAATVVPTGDKEAFAAALCKTLDDPEAARATGVRARSLVLQDYTWDAVASRFEKLIASELKLP